MEPRNTGRRLLVLGAGVPFCAALLGWVALAVARPGWSESAYFYVAVLLVSLFGFPHTIVGAVSVMPRRWPTGVRVIVGIAVGIAGYVASYVVAMAAFSRASLRLGYIE